MMLYNSFRTGSGLDPMILRLQIRLDEPSIHKESAMDLLVFGVSLIHLSSLRHKLIQLVSDFLN